MKLGHITLNKLLIIVIITITIIITISTIKSTTIQRISAVTFRGTFAATDTGD